MASAELKSVIDSSVIIKWFCEEEDTPKALALRENYCQGNAEIVFPDLSLYEVANALRHNKSITENDVKIAVESLIKMNVEIVVPTMDVMKSAINFAFRYNITVYDAYFLALAQTLRFTLITADESFYTKVKSIPFVTLLKDI
ncbi:MAG: type II toxin-antitoxin system VapC family toxin [Nanoarchaeota archaeon]